MLQNVLAMNLILKPLFYLMAFSMLLQPLLQRCCH